MRRLTNILLATVTSSTVAVASSGWAAADPSPAGGANNLVQVGNTVDGTSASRSRLSVAYDPADTAANQNIASATSSDCTGCRTVAVAMQVVVVEGYPHTFTPGNAAAAVNANCSSCQSLAFAYQYVVQPGRVVYLSAPAQQKLAMLRAQADQIASSNGSIDTVRSQLDSVFTQFVQTVNDDMQAAGAPVGNGQTSVATDAA